MRNLVSVRRYRVINVEFNDNLSSKWPEEGWYEVIIRLAVMAPTFIGLTRLRTYNMYEIVPLRYHINIKQTECVESPFGSIRIKDLLSSCILNRIFFYVVKEEKSTYS